MRHAHQLLHANGPRGFALIPKMAVATKEDGIFLNLYVPMEVTVKTGRKNAVALKVETGYPVNGKVSIGVEPQRDERFKLSLRIPSQVDGAEGSCQRARAGSAAPGRLSLSGPYVEAGR